MKIINIHYTGFGGLASVVHSLVSAPGADVHEWVMAYYGVVALDASHEAFCCEYGFRYASFRAKPRRPWRAWIALLRWLVSERPNAIVCHSITAIPPAALAARCCGAPLIAVEHTPNEVKSCSEWAGSSMAMMLADRVVVLTEAYAKYLAARLGPLFQSQKVRLCPNGLDPTVFFPRSEEFNRFTLRAGMAARLATTKLHCLLIDMAEELDFTLDLAGEGEMMATLKELVLTKTSTTRVSFSGLIPASQMGSWYRGLDLYLHASKGETFSMSILQAMATGLPIIASDISGMDEILGRDGTCGLLVSNTPDAWHSAISYLMRSPELRKRMGAAARRRAVAMYSSDAMFQGYHAVIEEVLNDRVYRLGL